ncbi:NUDIX domain-containing protein [Micromonospora sp. NPDC051300]|uniref:NUDIX domain-containing protein n=1 Tax=Micromonospora sp. NPDC051300 TaxID=3364286 RepID=UPI0037AB2C4B
MRNEIRALVEALPPGDELEARHRREALTWLAGTETVRRELREELDVPAVFAPAYGERPAFLTVTETVGPPEQRHTDVSLWFLLTADRGQRFTPDPVEFRGIRWWAPAEVTAAPAGTVEPHLGRMLAKLAAVSP